MIFVIGLFLAWLGAVVGTAFKKVDKAARFTFHLGFFMMVYSVLGFLWLHLP
jgi:hypothetical protein